MSMTESEALKTLECLQRLLTNYRHISKELTEANGMAISALSEIQQYRAIGTVSEFRENKNFLEFLCNAILPNEMEQYLAMYHASEEKGE